MLVTVLTLIFFFVLVLDFENLEVSLIVLPDFSPPDSPHDDHLHQGPDLLDHEQHHQRSLPLPGHEHYADLHRVL